METLVGLNGLKARLGRQVPREWIEAEALAGRLPCLKVGRRLLFSVEAVEAELVARAARERVGVAGDE